MGVIDTAKMIRKAQQARKQMSEVQVVGKSKSGLTAVLLNGLNEVEEVHFEDELFEDANKEVIAQEVIEATADARKNLEQEMASSMDLDSIRDMFGA